MKLVADINAIKSNSKNLESAIEEFTSAASSFQGASLNCPLDEISGALDSSKESISQDIEKLKTSSDEFKNLVNECASEYESNESNMKKISVDVITDLIKNDKAITVDYKGKAATVLTGLPSTEIKSPINSYIEAALEWAKMTAADDSIGYSQATRWGNPNYDCSSFAISAYQAAGIDVKGSGATYTGNMKDAFIAQGFTWYPGTPNVNDLQPGDVLLNESNHTEIYAGDGMNLGAHMNYDGVDGDSQGNEVSLAPYWDDNWDGYLRYEG